MDALQGVSKVTRMESMRTTAFNSYLFLMIEDGEREAKCVETACGMFGANVDGRR